MRLTVICAAIVVLAGCDGTTAIYTNTLVSEPSPAVTTQFIPAVLPLTTFPTACSTPHGLGWGTTFNLVVVQTVPQDVSIDHVTFRLITGESVGGPMITYPRPQLADMFGTTVVARQGVFAFKLEFGCHAHRPRSINADVTLIDGRGSRQTTTMSAGFE